MATQKHTITSDTYVSVGSGPLIVEVVGDTDIRVHFGVSLPDVGTEAFHFIRGTDSFSYGGRETAYVRSDKSGNAYAVVT